MPLCRFSLVHFDKPLSISPSPCLFYHTLVHLDKSLCPSRQALVHSDKPLFISHLTKPLLTSTRLESSREKKTKLSDAHTLLRTRPRKNAHLAAECYQFRQEVFATKAKLGEQFFGGGETSSMSAGTRQERGGGNFKQKAQQQHHEKEKLKAAAIIARLRSNKNTGNNDNKCTRKMLASPCCTPPDQLDHRRPPTHISCRR